VPNNTIEARLARMEERSEGILRELVRLTQEFDRLGGVTGEVIQWGGALGALEKDFQMYASEFKDFRSEYRDEMRREKEAAEAEHRRLRAEIEKAREEREKLRAEMQAAQRERRGMSTTLKGALIAAGGSIVVALIYAVLGHTS
jgi:predicted RNase H-like nuclease (RuvC/YqgF family)